MEWFAEEVYQLTNYEREKHGLPRLNRPNASFSSVAYVRAEEASILWDPNHLRPNGTEFYTAMTEAGYNTWTYAAENLSTAWPYSSNSGFESIPKMMVNDLMDSEGHRNNILSTRAKTLSIGVFHDNRPEANYAVYMAQLFSN